MHQFVSPPVSVHPNMSSFKKGEQAVDYVSHWTGPWKLVRTELDQPSTCRILLKGIKIHGHARGGNKPYVTDILSVQK